VALAHSALAVRRWLDEGSSQAGLAMKNDTTS
jgi:hypothetical protein